LQFYCDNNTISGNTVTNNGFDGIYFYYYCDNNTILGNTVDVNGINGIYLNNDCNDNIISGNTAINNSENGISLWSSNNTIVSGNIVNYNIQYGIYLTNSYTNILSGNTVNNNDCGISLQTGGDNNNFSNNFIYFSQYQSIEIKSTNCDDNLIQRNILVSKEGEFITNLGNNTIIKDNYYGVKEPSFVVEVIDLSFSTTVFVLTINVSSQAAFLQFSNLSTQMWWDGVNISSDIVEVGNGLYNVSLTPIFVEPDENPILLNITFSAAHHSDKFFETYISVEPDSEPEEVAKLLYIDILSQIFSIEKFNITFFVFNESKHGIGSGTIQMWWNGSDVSSHIQNLGNGFYFVSLEPLTVKPGEEPIILEIAISTSEYEDFSFETYISVDPDILIEDDIIPSEFPFFLIIIIITSIASGIGITGAILFLLRRRKGVSEVINTNEP